MSRGSIRKLSLTPPQAINGETVLNAINRTVQARWHGTRSCRFNEGQAVLGFAAVIRYTDPARSERYTTDRDLLAATPLAAIRRDAIAETVTKHWLHGQGMSAVAINSRLNAMSACGADVTGCRLKRPRKLKWWLHPDEHAKLDKWLRSVDRHLVADYIQWVTNTGMRVEETLKIKRRDFFVGEEGLEVTVRGTKTRASQATLPLNEEAAGIAAKRFAAPGGPDEPLFDISYRHLAVEWRECRAALGLGFDNMATLKALRRSFTRKATARGMPLDMLRDYLRHESVSTTMDYLRLVGGYKASEMRKFL